MNEREPRLIIPKVVYKVPNPDDNFSELYIVFGEELLTATDPDRIWVVKETHGFWDDADTEKKFKKNTDTLSPNDPKHCLSIEEAFEAIDRQVASRARSGFKYMFTRDFFDPPFFKKFEILPDGTQRELPAKP
jgi:hypothetical protein